MTSLYVDTSALARLLLEQPDAPLVERELTRFDRLVSSRLLALELRRVALREGLREAADALLETVALVPVDEPLFSAAESVEPNTVASLDAIHLATAVRMKADDGLDAIMTYDVRLAEGARHHGIAVVAPA